MCSLQNSVRSSGLEVRIYPPSGLFGHVSYIFGRLFGRMPRGCCHVTTIFYLEGQPIERHLTIQGIELLDRYPASPTISYFFPLTLRELKERYVRMALYEMHGYRVTVGSLVSSLVYPNKANPALCTSFAEFLLFGRVSALSNNVTEFILELAWRHQKQTQK